jgi:hypothetical protein
MNDDLSLAQRSLSTSEYVLALFEPADNVAILSRNRRTGRTIQRIATAENVVDPQFQSWLRGENAAGSDIFIGMNPVKNGADGRTKENIAIIRHLYLDLDRGGQDALAAIRNSPEVPAPNFVLDTSQDKHQVVWSVEGVELQAAESMLRAMAAEFGGDPAATDATRVLRLPGYTNKKYDEEFIVVVHQETTERYQGRDFQLAEDSSGRFRNVVSEARTKTAQGHRSQSEQDWAYAKRALARGDDPQEVMRRIADFRADEKHDPEYYARHTVEKAQAALRGPISSPSSEVAESSDPSREML